LSNLDDLINRIRNRPATKKIVVLTKPSPLDDLVQAMTAKDTLLDEAAETLERLKDALAKIGGLYPCNTVETMSRLARETIGMKDTTE
jgi:hypothetical protein